MKQLDGPWFTLTQLQDLLDMADRDHLKKLLTSAGVQHRKIGREWFFATDQFVQWIKSGSSASVDETEAA